MRRQIFKMKCMRRARIELALVCLVSGVCLGCTVTRDEVVGTYYLQYEFGRERLLLGADGSYEQSFEGTGTSRAVNRGRWELQSNGDQIIVLHNPMLVADPFGKARLSPLRESGVALLRVKKWLGAVALVLNGDQGLRFEKRA
jgi:hypothetical protein